eukprot:9484493-Pyramimonas_sp.AAC.1
MGGGGGPPTPAAVQGAINRCMFLIKKGPKHVRINEESRRLEWKRKTDTETVDHVSTSRHTRFETKDAVRQSKELVTPAPKGNAMAADTPPVTVARAAAHEGAASGATASGDVAAVAAKPAGTSPDVKKQTAKGTGKAGKAKKGKGKAKAQAKSNAKAATPKTVDTKARAVVKEY